MRSKPMSRGRGFARPEPRPVKTIGVDIDAAHYKPAWNANALTQRILDFYRRNPDEWLCYRDMSIKFGCNESQAQQACAWLRRNGAAVQTNMPEGRRVLVQLKPIEKGAT